MGTEEFRTGSFRAYPQGFVGSTQEAIEAFSRDAEDVSRVGSPW